MLFEGVERAGSLSLLKHKRGDSKEINLFYTMNGDHTFKVQKICTSIKEAVQKVVYMTHALYSRLPFQIEI